MPLKLKRVSSPPVSVSGNSVLFNGSNQYLSIASNANFGFGASDYTIEFWTYYSPISNSNGKMVIDSRPTATNGDYWNFGTSNTGIMAFSPSIGGTTITDTVARTNQWVHYAVSRSGSSLKLFANGTQVASTTDSSTTLASGLLIGANAFRGIATDTYWLGYISNIRILKGTALYTASFTAPTSPLTTVASCSLLTCQSPTIVDNSGNNFTITNNGTATVSSAVTPFTSTSYASTFKFRNVNNNAIAFSGTQRAIFGYGRIQGAPFYTSNTNLVSNTGVVSTDTAGVGLARYGLAAAGYGGDKAIFGYGYDGRDGFNVNLSITSHVSNTGVVATDTAGVGTARQFLAAAGYGSDKAIFGYGQTSGVVSLTNLVSNTGVVASDTTGVGTVRNNLAAASYGTGTAIFGYGTTSGFSAVSMTNKVSNTGVVATDTTGVGTARPYLAAAGYGSDKAIFGYGRQNNAGISLTNLVSNTGVVATDTSGVGTARYGLAAAGYGGDKAIFGYGNTLNSSAGTGGVVSMTNLVSNTGVVASDTTGVGTAREYSAAAGYSVSYGPAPSGGSFKKVYADPIIYLTQKAIFGYGVVTTYSSLTNLVSNTGVVATNTTGVGTARGALAAAGYGTDKAIFGYGQTSIDVSMTNLVSNIGVIATDTTGVGTARAYLAAAGYGTDKAIFGYGTAGAMTNLVSNTGVVSTDTTGVGTARNGLAAAGYGTDKAIFGYGYASGDVSMTNKVSNTGIVATDTTGVGTARYGLAAAGYGSDKAIFGYGLIVGAGSYSSITNLVNNTGVVATDTTGVGTARYQLAAASYGSDKAIFGYGNTGATVSMTNLVSNTGVVATDTAGVGTARRDLAASGYSLT